MYSASIMFWLQLKNGFNKMSLFLQRSSIMFWKMVFFKMFLFSDPSNFLIGRTEYNIMMYDSRAEGRKWNISFYDYSSNLGGVEVGPDYSKF